LIRERKTNILPLISPVVKKLIIARDRYLNLLALLNKRELFGKLSIYPAIGVDALVLLFSGRVIGLNWSSYDCRSIMDLLHPILSPVMASKLKSKLHTNMTFIPKIDAPRLYVVVKELGPHRNISPKSLILKGSFEKIFLREWDADMERFYAVPVSSATVAANNWIREMANWLIPGDTIIAFDRQLFPFLSEQDSLEEIDLDIKDPGEEFDEVYARVVPILFLPSFVRVFKKCSI
jgi:hypothetical protein